MRCSKCQADKPEAEFSWRYKAKGQRQDRCKLCLKSANAQHYSSNKKKYSENNKKIELQNRERLLAWLEGHPCVDCGERDPVVLEFDHADPSTKVLEISFMIRQSYSWETIALEIAKCSVRCANCHRRKTAKQFGWWKSKVSSSVGRAQDSKS